MAHVSSRAARRVLPSLIWSAIQKLPFLFQLWFCFTSLARLPCPQPLQPAAQAYAASLPQLLFLSSAISQPWPPRKMSANSSNPAKTYFSFIPGTPYQDRSSTEEILPYLLGPGPCPPRFSSSPLFDPHKGKSSWSWGKVLHGDRHALGILAAAGTQGTFLSLGWWVTCTRSQTCKLMAEKLSETWGKQRQVDVSPRGSRSAGLDEDTVLMNAAAGGNVQAQRDPPLQVNCRRGWIKGLTQAAGFVSYLTAAFHIAYTYSSN